LQDGIKPTEIEGFTGQQFHLADLDGDERVDYEEFVAYYQSISTTKARRELRSALGPQAESDPLSFHLVIHHIFLHSDLEIFPLFSIGDVPGGQIILIHGRFKFALLASKRAVAGC